MAIGHSVLMALNCNKDIPEADYEKEMGVEAGYCYHCHTGTLPGRRRHSGPDVAQTFRSRMPRRSGFTTFCIASLSNVR